MTLVNAITQQPNQKINLILSDNSVIQNFIMQYMDGNQGWYFSLVYGTFVINNMRAVVSPNMIRFAKGVVPFGLGIDTTDGYESLFIDDFSKGRASLYLLDETDVNNIEKIILNVS